MVDIRTYAENEVAAIQRVAETALTLDHIPLEITREKCFRLFADQIPVRLAAFEKSDMTGFVSANYRPSKKLGQIVLFAVQPNHQRQGIGTRLFDMVEEELTTHGAKTILALKTAPVYLWPGLDPRYTATVSFLEGREYNKTAETTTLRVGLSTPFDIEELEAKVAKAGYSVRPAVQADATSARELVLAEFSKNWALETEECLDDDPSRVMLAIIRETGRIVGFAAHSVQNKPWGWFGPIGLLAECRGGGVGELLLKKSLNDLAARGFKSAVIPWTRIHRWYHRKTGAMIERVFWTYEKKCGS